MLCAATVTGWLGDLQSQVPQTQALFCTDYISPKAKRVLPLGRLSITFRFHFLGAEEVAQLGNYLLCVCRRVQSIPSEPT